MTASTTARRAAGVAAIAIVSASCGGTAATEPSASDTPPSTGTVETTEAAAEATTDSPNTQPNEPTTADEPTTDSTEATTDTPETTEPVEPGAPALASLLSNERVGLGWEVPAGTWASDAFLRPIEFDTPAPLTLVGEYTDVVVFANPARPDSRNFLYVAKSSFMHNGDNRAPTPLSTEDVTLVIDALDHVTLLANSTDGTDTPWWELSVDNFTNGAPYGCTLGDRCGPVSFTRGRVPINTLEGERSRFYRTTVGDDTISVHVTGEPDGLDDLIEIAESIVHNVRPATGARVDTEYRFFGTVPTNGATPEPGTYVARFPNATLHLDLDELPAGMNVTLSLMNTIWISSSRVGIGIVPTERFIDPTADQLAMQGINETEYHYVDAITTDDAYLEWSAAMYGTPIEVETSTIGGQRAISILERDDDRTVIPRPCTAGDAHDAEGDCLTTWTTDNLAWWSPVTPAGEESPDTGKSFFVADAGLKITISAFDDTTIDDALDLVQPLLDGLTITPVDGSNL